MTSRKDSERLAAIFLKAKLIDDLQLRSSMARLANFGGRLPRMLSEMGFCDEDELTAAIGKSGGFPVTMLGHVLKDTHAMAKLDVKFCEEHCVFPVTLKDRVLALAMVDPLELDVIDAVKVRAGVRVQPLLSSETGIRNAILKHYKGQEPRVVSNRARKAVTREVSTNEDIKFEVDMAPPPKPRTPTVEALRKSAGVGFTKEELAKLESARVNQSKTATILKAVEELLTEKGLMPAKR